MTARRARVTKTEILSALRALKQFGEPLELTILPDGTIRIAPMTGGKVLPEGAKDANDVVMGRLER